jgi:hypothetical protein
MKYFLSISFKWKNVIELLGIPDSEFSNYKILKEHGYISKNPCSSSDNGMNKLYANFEYFIESSSQKKYPFGAFYDQQTKRFYESPNILYGIILKNTKNDDLSISCSFHDNAINERPGFIISTNELQTKALVFLFERDLLNIHEKKIVLAGDDEEFRAFRIHLDADYKHHTIELKVSRDIFWPMLSVQSIEDSGSAPYFGCLREFLK